MVVVRPETVVVLLERRLLQSEIDRPCRRLGLHAQWLAEPAMRLSWLDVSIDCNPVCSH